MSQLCLGRFRGSLIALIALVDAFALPAVADAKPGTFHRYDGDTIVDGSTTNAELESLENTTSPSDAPLRGFPAAAGTPVSVTAPRV